jgi:DMSO/TMAO reductase YedYZ molybdopterin-dependent catalytic subunit
MSRRPFSRRRFLAGGAATLTGAMLAGCDRVSSNEHFQNLLDLTEQTNLKLQRLLLRAEQPAREYLEADISPWFKPNGSTDPADAEYRQHVRSNFARWQLVVDGLVERPGRYTHADLRAMPSGTQITRHDCVEGWSCIGKWRGVPLAHLLDQVVPKPQARYVVFHCADTMDVGETFEGGEQDNTADQAGTGPSQAPGGGAPDALPTTNDAPRQAAQDHSAPAAGEAPGGPKYYESIDLVDARHVQTILAYDMNDKALPVPHGAPLRLRLERQLGYKMAKYVMRIELAGNLTQFGQGRGGYWEDQGYDWYAGI